MYSISREIKYRVIIMMYNMVAAALLFILLLFQAKLDQWHTNG